MLISQHPQQCCAMAVRASAATCAICATICLPISKVNLPAVTSAVPLANIQQLRYRLFLLQGNI